MKRDREIILLRYKFPTSIRGKKTNYLYYIISVYIHITYA